MDETTKYLKLIEEMGFRQQESQKRLEARLKQVNEEIEKDVKDAQELSNIKNCVEACPKGR